MVGTVEEFESFRAKNSLAESIGEQFRSFYDQRRGWVTEKKELRNYIFATDTTSTTNATLPWRNKTTLPKLCQIRDNLHANYMAAIFPNDNWIKWEGYNEDAATEDKREKIEAYVSNKVRISEFRNTVSKLLYDYIDYGNCFGEVRFVREVQKVEGQEDVDVYVGPKLFRISPLDIVFNPTAIDFASSPKITRYLKSMGEMKKEAETKPELGYDVAVIAKAEEIRRNIGQYDTSDLDKAEGFEIDGFGSLQEYYGSTYVEILEFEGDIHDPITGEFLQNQIITVIDRTHVLRQQVNESWVGSSNKFHCGWRMRPDNAYAMGPLDNLVGMQYRIDHLENIKADLFDLIALPPIKIRGDVEEFEWGPLAEIYVGDDGDVDILKVDATALQADTQIAILENKMEDFAGAPKQAMGIRTPGEKTAYEVQSLENASGRIFQDKATNFEINIVEPALNLYLEVGRRNLNGKDLVRVLDDELAISDFLEITRDDITAKGKLRPIGARHFAATAQLIQNLSGGLQIAASIPGVLNHVSGKKLAKLYFEEVAGLARFDLVQDNIAITEQAESQRIINQAQEDVDTEQGVSLDEDVPDESIEEGDEDALQ